MRDEQTDGQNYDSQDRASIAASRGKNGGIRTGPGLHLRVVLQQTCNTRPASLVLHLPVLQFGSSFSDIVVPAFSAVHFPVPHFQRPHTTSGQSNLTKRPHCRYTRTLALLKFPYQVGECGVCTPSNTWFLRPTRVHNPNGISIGSAVLQDSQSSQTDRPTEHVTSSVAIGWI